MIDIHGETLVTLTQASGLLPARPHLATIYRWMLRGVRGVTLETCMIGGKRYTSHEALQRFSDSLSNPARKAKTPRPSVHRQRALDAADRELDAAKI